MIQRKENWEEIQKFIESKNIKCLFHFTDYANFESILKMSGLYSREYLENNGIIIPSPGGNDISRDLDIRKKLGNYVRLSFIEDPPMLYTMVRDGRIAHPIIIKVDVDVLYWDRTKYSNMNATKTDEELSIGDKFEDLKKIIFSVFEYDYFEIPDEYKKYYQAEILVNEKIPIKFLIGCSE